MFVPDAWFVQELDPSPFKCSASQIYCRKRSCSKICTEHSGTEGKKWWKQEHLRRLSEKKVSLNLDRGLGKTSISRVCEKTCQTEWRYRQSCGDWNGARVIKDTMRNVLAGVCRASVFFNLISQVLNQKWVLGGMFALRRYLKLREWKRSPSGVCVEINGIIA